eukprot:COSAG02_NODE_2794_length_8016_cov_5.159783_2_plen_97_part_00
MTEDLDRCFCLNDAGHAPAQAADAPALAAQSSGGFSHVPLGSPAQAGSVFFGRSAAATARDQAARNLAETGELARKTDDMQQNAVNFANMAAALNR